MIFYFSGTGNSKFIAEKIAKSTKDEAKSIGELMKKNTPIRDIVIKDQLGIIFPVYAWRAPEIVEQFIEQLLIPEDTYIFAICTCGSEAGYTMRFFKKHLPFNAAWSLQMPDNYIKMWDVNSYEEALSKVEKSEKKLISIIKSIKAKEKVFDAPVGSLPYIKSYIVNPFFKKVFNTAKGFYAEETCSSCGLCETLCPLNNIVLVNGHPTWGKNCNQCLACIHHCPEKAIQYGKHTKNRGRYTFEGTFKKDV